MTISSTWILLQFLKVTMGYFYIHLRTFLIFRSFKNIIKNLALKDKVNFWIFEIKQLISRTRSVYDTWSCKIATHEAIFIMKDKRISIQGDFWQSASKRMAVNYFLVRCAYTLTNRVPRRIQWKEQLLTLLSFVRYSGCPKNDIFTLNWVFHTTQVLLKPLKTSKISKSSPVIPLFLMLIVKNHPVLPERNFLAS